MLGRHAVFPDRFALNGIPSDHFFSVLRYCLYCTFICIFIYVLLLVSLSAQRNTMQQLLARKSSCCCPLQLIPHRPQSHSYRHASKQQQQQLSRTTCAAALLPELQTLLGQAGAAHPGWAAGAAVNAAVFAAGSPVLLKGLTGWGMVNAFILGTTVFAAFGAGGFGLVCIYFLFGTAVSVVRRAEQAEEGGGGFNPDTPPPVLCVMHACMSQPDVSLLSISVIVTTTHPLEHCCRGHACRPSP